MEIQKEVEFILEQDYETKKQLISDLFRKINKFEKKNYTLRNKQMGKYRLLTNQDKIKSNDEFLNSNCETWSKIGNGKTIGETWMINCKYNGNFFVPIRRIKE